MDRLFDAMVASEPASADRARWSFPAIKPLRRERSLGQFERTITLPIQVDVESAAAHLTDGVLSITLPKAPAFQPRRIAIRSGAEAS